MRAPIATLSCGWTVAAKSSRQVSIAPTTRRAWRSSGAATILEPYTLEFIIVVTREMLLGSNAERCRSLVGSACGRPCGSQARNRKADVVINRHFAVDVVKANADGDVIADHHVVGR
jgi:hypothetical protein